MAVIDNYREHRKAAQALQFGDVGGQPGWALNGQGERGKFEESEIER